MSMRISPGSFMIIISLLALELPCSSAPGNDPDASIDQLINSFSSNTAGNTNAQSNNLQFVDPYSKTPSDVNQSQLQHRLSSSGYKQHEQALPASPQLSGKELPQQGPKLTLANGTVMGKILKLTNLDHLPSIETDDCLQFLGVPYAAAPVDQLRFKAPTAAAKWTGVYDATKYKSACQQDPRAMPQAWTISEDCLHVNIFKPALTKMMPAVIWVHGGGFIMGSATTLDPATACRQAVVNSLVVITINYRLGPFGFIGHESMPTTDTNLGLRDIGQAIRWVIENSDSLSIEPKNIVLAGHGAGAALVSHTLDSSLISMPWIKGAILMSGSGAAPWAITKHSFRSSGRLLRKFDCASVDCLQKLDSSKFFEQAQLLWSPYVDNTLIFASDDGKRKQATPNFPIIMGFTMQEGTALAVEKLAPPNGQLLREKITRSLADLTGETHDAVETHFLHERNVPVNFFDSIFDYVDALSDAYSDILFKLPSVREATARTQQYASNVYLYAIRHDMPLPGRFLPGYKASYHGSDLDLFWTPYSKQSRVNLLGAFLQVILHQNETMPWKPWSPQSPVMLLVTPYGGQFVTYRPIDSNAPSVYSNHTYFLNTTVKYGSPHLTWTPTRRPPMVTATATSVLFGATSAAASGIKTTPAPSKPNAPPKFNFGPNNRTSTTSTVTPTTNATMATENTTVAITTAATSTPASSTPLTSGSPATSTSTTKEPSTTSKDTKDPPQQNSSSFKFASKNGTGENNASSTGQQDSLVWVLLGLAVLFLFLFLITVGGCAAWNRQSYHPHPNRRSRHQGAKVRQPPQAPPSIAPTAATRHQLHQQRSNKESSNYVSTTDRDKQTARRTTGHHGTNNASANNNGTTSRRPRQPPPNLPPLLAKDGKRN